MLMSAQINFFLTSQLHEVEILFKASSMLFLAIFYKPIERPVALAKERYKPVRCLCAQMVLRRVTMVRPGLGLGHKTLHSMSSTFQHPFIYNSIFENETKHVPCAKRDDKEN